MHHYRQTNSLLLWRKETLPINIVQILTCHSESVNIWRNNRCWYKESASSHTFVVLILFPVAQLQPLRSGRTLHSSPSRQGCIWHHHFCSTMEAVGGETDSFSANTGSQIQDTIQDDWRTSTDAATRSLGGMIYINRDGISFLALGDSH